MTARIAPPVNLVELLLAQSLSETLSGAAIPGQRVRWFPHPLSAGPGPRRGWWLQVAVNGSAFDGVARRRWHNEEWLGDGHVPVLTERARSIVLGGLAR